MSVFNADEFMNTTVEGAIDTTIIPVPEEDYPGQVDKLTYRTLDDGQVVMDIHWEVLDDAVKELTHMDKPICRQGIWLDLNDSGHIDLSPGKNRQLGLVREALGQNTGKPWSPNMMLGQVGTIKVKHSPNAKDPGSPYANVVAVTSQSDFKSKKAA